MRGGREGGERGEMEGGRGGGEGGGRDGGRKGRGEGGRGGGREGGDVYQRMPAVYSLYLCSPLEWQDHQQKLAEALAEGVSQQLYTYLET